MPNYANPKCITLVVGAGECGKTGFCLKYLLNAPACCRFIFDVDGQVARRLRIKPCRTEKECLAAVPTGWVCLDPYGMWEAHQLENAVEWFCQFAFQMSDLDNGQYKKILFIDELWQFANNRMVPPKLENVVRKGRHVNLEFLSSTHRPAEYHELIRSQASEWGAFNLVEPNQLDKIRPYWSGAWTRPRHWPSVSTSR